jgi:hypothetical protein
MLIGRQEGHWFTDGHPSDRHYHVRGNTGSQVDNGVDSYLDTELEVCAM